MNISILGSGSWGSALSSVLSDNKYNVNLWHRNQSFVDKKNENLINCNNLNYTSDLTVFKNSDLLLIALPSHIIRSVLRKIKINKNTIIVNCSKGFDLDSEKRLSSVIIKELGISPDNFSVLSGPSHAEEVVSKIPTAVVVASSSFKTGKLIQKTFSNNYFRVYTNSDVEGVEIAGACKNIISIAAGICIGLKYGDNTIAALISRGIQEIVRFGVKYKAKEATFYGLAGIGDLSVTAYSKFSRNREFGIKIGEGLNKDKANKKIKMIVEGVNASQVIYKLSKKNEINMPIVNEVYSILFEDKNPKKAINELMKRKLTIEY